MRHANALGGKLTFQEFSKFVKTAKIFPDLLSMFEIRKIVTCVIEEDKD
jgi:hypothetical protein